MTRPVWTGVDMIMSLLSLSSVNAGYPANHFAFCLVNL